MTFPRGNLAPDGSVIKSTSIDPSVVGEDGVYRLLGRARVFTREREAMRAIKSKGPDKVLPGDVVHVPRKPPGLAKYRTAALLVASPLITAILFATIH